MQSWFKNDLERVQEKFQSRREWNEKNCCKMLILQKILKENLTEISFMIREKMNSNEIVVKTKKFFYNKREKSFVFHNRLWK